MYDSEYSSMVDAKVANPIDKSEYCLINRYGRRFKTQEEAAGHQIKHHLSHPKYFLFGDEVGTDTNQMDDGNNGGQQYISIKVMKTNLISSKSSGCFTFMGITTVNSDPLLCICIFSTQSLSVTDVKVFNYRSSIPYDSSNTMEKNMGDVKSLHGLPVCKFRGGSITCLMYLVAAAD